LSGITGIGVMDPKIAPLWRDVETMDHRFCGIAVTARYGPTNRPMHAGARPDVSRSGSSGDVLPHVSGGRAGRASLPRTRFRWQGAYPGRRFLAGGVPTTLFSLAGTSPPGTLFLVGTGGPPVRCGEEAREHGR
jgi:hypothetical protein